MSGATLIHDVSEAFCILKVRKTSLAVRLAERKATIQSGPTLFLRTRHAIIASRSALLRHLKTAWRTLLPAGRTNGLLGCFGHCDFDACLVGPSENRGGKKY
jgi:hypothetical protein